MIVNPLISNHERPVLEFISIPWYGIFTPLIFTAIFTTNFVPYLGDAIDILINRCWRKKTRSNNYFDIEKKLTQRLLTIFVVFTYGYAMPVLFPFSLIPLTFTLILDKYLMIYWLAPTVVQSNQLINLFRYARIFAPVLLFLIATFTISNCSSIEFGMKGDLYYLVDQKPV